MPLFRASRLAALIAASAACLGAAVACVDVFHSTEFETLCARDAQACSAQTAAAEDAGDAGDAGPTGPPILDFCAWPSARAATEAKHACAWLGACAGGITGFEFGECSLRALAAYDCSFNPVLRPRGETERLWSCLAQVESCADVDKCLFPDGVPPCTQGAGSGTFTACAGAMRVECSGEGRPTGIEPCGLTGRACTEMSSSYALCARPSGPCDDQGSTTCKGTAAVQCTTASGIPRDVGPDCANFGAGTCTVGKGNTGAACAPNADAGTCAAGIELTCNTTGAVSSCVGGKEVVVFCKKQDGLGCRNPGPSTDPVSGCEGSEPDVASREECAGDALKSKVRFKTFDVRCSDLGLGPCKQKGSGGVVACSPPP